MTIVSAVYPQDCHGYLKPYYFAKFLAEHKTFKVIDVCFSRFMLINHLISHRYVPCKVTTCYKIVKKFLEDDLPKEYNWSELEKHGKKPYTILSKKSRTLLPVIMQCH